MPHTTADISIQLLMDTTNALQEIETRMTARAFIAVYNPEQGPAVRWMLEEVLEVMDSTMASIPSLEELPAQPSLQEAAA